MTGKECYIFVFYASDLSNISIFVCMISDREIAAFEAGIKLGAIYHQWTGTPVSKQSADSLEDAIEKAHKLQPYVASVSVTLDRTRIIPNTFGYSELTGLMFDVHLTTCVNTTTCKTRLSAVGGYPLMEIKEFNE